MGRAVKVDLGAVLFRDVLPQPAHFWEAAQPKGGGEDLLQVAVIARQKERGAMIVRVEKEMFREEDLAGLPQHGGDLLQVAAPGRPVQGGPFVPVCDQQMVQGEGLARFLENRGEPVEVAALRRLMEESPA